jgi:hypothetical protein
MGRAIAGGLQDTEVELIVPLLKDQFGDNFHVFPSVHGMFTIAMTGDPVKVEAARYFVMGWRRCAPYCDHCFTV